MNLLTLPPGYVWEDMPAAETEAFGSTLSRTKLDLDDLATVRHAFTCPEADEAAPGGRVQPSHWNAAHVAKLVAVRLVVNVRVAGFAGAQLRAQYSLDGLAWVYFDGAAGPAVAIDALGLQVGAWVNLAVQLSDVFVRLVGIGGDAAVDPEFGLIQLQGK